MSNHDSDYQQWLTTIRGLSKKYQKFGSFLTAQEKLLLEIYNSLTVFNQKVVSFTAPPASGKTHVIVLSAAYLVLKGNETCIVTPNGELSVDFNEELKEITAEKLLIPILSIPSYRKIKGKFDYVLMDEAHNLRSALELDHKLLKSFQFKEGDGFYELLAPQANTQKYSTKELNIETSSDILRKMCRTENSRDAKQLLKTLSQWRGYCVTFRDTCNLHFLLADPKKRNVLPKGRLFLFSATRLDQEELCFYCDIPKNLVKTLGEEKVGFTPKANVNYGYLPCDVDTNKMKLSISLLEKINQPSLILLNNKQNCETWASELGKVLVNRVITIESGLSHAQRLRAYRKFFEKENSILLTSSNVFWEGITIKELKILLIPNIPFPQPTMLELAEERSPEYRKIAERRLIQGIGRIGRVPQTKGVCILFFRPPKSFGYFAKISPSEICKFAEQISI